VGEEAHAAPTAKAKKDEEVRRQQFDVSKHQGKATLRAFA
jgi:hypothetical protein